MFVSETTAADVFVLDREEECPEKDPLDTSQEEEERVAAFMFQQCTFMSPRLRKISALITEVTTSALAEEADLPQ